MVAEWQEGNGACSKINSSTRIPAFQSVGSGSLQENKTKVPMNDNIASEYFDIRYNKLNFKKQ